MYFELCTFIRYNVFHVSVDNNHPNSRPDGQSFQRLFLITKLQYQIHKLQVTDSQIQSTSSHILKHPTLILSSKLDLDLQSTFFPSAFAQRQFYTFLVSSWVLPIPLIAQIFKCYYTIIHEDIKLWSSSLRSFLHPALYPSVCKEPTHIKDCKLSVCDAPPIPRSTLPGKPADVK